MRVGFLLLLALAGTGSVNAAELAEIQDRGYLIVGVKDNLRPLGFKDSQNQLQGFEIDIARQLAADLLGDDQAVEFRPLLNQERLNALLEGDVDVLVARMSITDARTRLVAFSRPYYVDGAAFITRDSTIRSLRDLRQRPIAVLTGSDTIPTIRSLLPSVRLQGVETYAEAQRLLDSGQAAAFAADATVLTGWVQESPEYFLIPTLISAEALAIAMPKGAQYGKLQQQINEAVDRWQTNGWLRQRISAWGLLLEGFPSFTDPPTDPATDATDAAE